MIIESETAKPIKTDRIRVSDVHELYYEEWGNPEGKPAIFLHGGPGSGCNNSQTQFFDLAKYRLILFDQRGSGRSTPHACVEENSLQYILNDIESLRQLCRIEKWLVFGGSWGSTLALAYSQSFPERVSELVIRGIMLGRPEEMRWLYEEGASMVFPEAWERFLVPIRGADYDDAIHAYHELLFSTDSATQLDAAVSWSAWEGATSYLHSNDQEIAKSSGHKFALARARIETHYFVNGCFLENEDQLILEIDKIRHIPAVMVHGRYDMVCPIKNAFDLFSVWPEASLEIIADAGHSAFEPGIFSALTRATDRFANSAY